MSILKSRTTQNTAAGQLVTTGGPAGILLAVRNAYPELIPWPVELDAILLAFLATTLGPWLARMIAFWRNPEKRSVSSGGSGTVPGIALFLCATLALSGCATTLPAVGGKTHYNVEFSDVTADQATNYKMDIKAPAGVELATVTGMTYNWTPDGSGNISVSERGNVDTSGQAALIAEVSRQQMEAFKAGMDATLKALAPLLGPYLQSKDNRAAIEAPEGLTP
jgi:uncharacterized protein YceK